MRDGAFDLRLGPYESVFIVFSDVASSAPPPSVYRRSNTSPSALSIPAPLELTLSWKLQLNGESIQLDRLKSWTELGKFRYFSGRGVYEAEFDFPVIPTGTRTLLDLGQVGELADIAVNGVAHAVTWMRPHAVDITRTLQPGRNHLRIEVANLLINRVLGEGPIDYSKVIAKCGDRFPAGDEWELIREPLPSGLMGPVRLVFSRAIA